MSAPLTEKFISLIRQIDLIKRTTEKLSRSRFSREQAAREQAVCEIEAAQQDGLSFEEGMVVVDHGELGVAADVGKEKGGEGGGLSRIDGEGFTEVYEWL